MSQLVIGDHLVLPTHHGVGFPAYVRREDGSAEGEPLVHVPLPGRQGVEWLCDDRLVAPGVRGGSPDIPFSGVAFFAERGGELVDNKLADEAAAVWGGESLASGQPWAPAVRAGAQAHMPGLSA